MRHIREGGVQASILDEVAEAILKYVAMPDTNSIVAATLWTVATHLAAEFDTATRLIIRSAEKRSGKSRLMNEVIRYMVCNAEPMSNTTMAGIYATINDNALAGELPTLLVDEYDAMFGPKAGDKYEDVRAILNAGYRRGNPITRGQATGNKVVRIKQDTFAMVALAGIGRLPDTIEDRGVIVTMRRRKASEKVSPFRHKRDAPTLEAVRAQIAEWAETVRDEAGTHEPENMGVEDRAADIWEPLIVVADLAGGEWPELARRAAVEMTTDAMNDDQEDKESTRLLRDIQYVFRIDAMPSKELVDRLQELEESPWNDPRNPLSVAKLGNKLKPYEITPRRLYVGGKQVRRYVLADFQDAFDRYLT